MRFIDHGAGGGADVLALAERERPVVGAGQVLIEVAYAGVNRPDVAQRSGSYPPPAGASPVLGLEVAGRIVDKAADVESWSVGDLVCALTPGGGYAEFCLAPASNCLPIPEGLTLEQAASLPETFFTVWANLFGHGHLAPGETALIHGGSSGIGVTAIQLARAFGARVFVTVGNEQKAEFCRELGAAAAINYREQDFAQEVAGLTERRGVDVILDMVGGSYIESNIRSLAKDGRLVQIAFLQGSKATLDLLPIMTRRLTLTGSTMRPRTVEEKAAIAADLRQKVWPLLASRTVQPVIYATFDMADAAQAHRLMEDSRHIGKIMLAVKPDSGLGSAP